MSAPRIIPTGVLQGRPGPEGRKGERGERGEKGDSVVGPKGDRGLPGVNAVPADEAVATYATTPGSATAAALMATIASGMGELDRPLDIWPEFKTGVTFNDATYPGWIAGIDAALGSAATKTDLGAASDGTTRVYSYTAGKVGAPEALLLSGVHGHEINNQHACFRWFEAFAKSADPAMVEMRQRVRVIWIPTVNPSPSAFHSTRYNANRVDLNRNQPFFWAMTESAPESSDRGTKGPAAGSEAESVILKNVLDNTNVTFVLDCHMWGTDGVHVKFYPLSGWAPGDRTIGTAARERWERTYNPSNTYTSDQFGSEFPSVTNWAGKYLWLDKGRKSATALLVEVNSNVAGANSTTSPREFLRVFCGAIQSSLVSWLAAGHRPAPVPVEHLAAWRHQDSSLPTVKVSEGGNLLDTTAYQNFHTFIDGSGTKTKFVDFPLKAPSRVKVTITALLQGDAAETAVREVQFICGLSRAADATAEPNDVAQSLARMPASPGGRQETFSKTFTLPVSVMHENMLMRLTPKFRLLTTGTPVIIRQVTIDIEVSPTGTASGGAWATTWNPPA